MKKRLFFSLRFFVKIALATVLPLVVFALPGIVLDKKLDTLPSLTVVGFALSLLATVILVRIISHKTAIKIKDLD